MQRQSHCFNARYLLPCRVPYKLQKLQSFKVRSLLLLPLPNTRHRHSISASTPQTIPALPIRKIIDRCFSPDLNLSTSATTCSLSCAKVIYVPNLKPFRRRLLLLSASCSAFFLSFFTCVPYPHQNRWQPPRLRIKPPASIKHRRELISVTSH